MMLHGCPYSRCHSKIILGKDPKLISWILDMPDISDISEIDMDTSKLPFGSPDHSKLGSKAGHSKLGTDRAVFLFKFSKTTRDPP